MSYDSVGPRPPKLRGQQYQRAHLLVLMLVVHSLSILQGIVTSGVQVSLIESSRPRTLSQSVLTVALARCLSRPD